MKKSSIIYLLFLMVSISNLFSESWEIINLPVTNSYVNSVFFYDKDIGWVSGKNSNTGDCFILYTDDGGDNWSDRSPGLTGAVELFFIDAEIGYGAGYDFATSSPLLLKTTNAGQEWTSLSSPAANAVYTGLFFLDENTGWACGSLGGSNDPVYIANTTDSGDTWTEQTVPVIRGGLRQMFFADENNGWAVGNKNMTWAVILHTSDGGATWTEQDPGVASGTLSDVFFIDANNGWACGSLAEGKLILRTTDGGNSWSSSTLAQGNTATSIHFMSVTEGYVSANENESLALVYKTDDGGASWEEAVDPMPGSYISELNVKPGSRWLFASLSDKRLGRTKAGSSDKYTLTLSVLPPQAETAGCTATPSGEYDPNALIKCVAAPVPEKYWYFSHWSGDVSGNATTTVKMDEDKKGTAHFVQPTLTISGSGQRKFICPEEVKDEVWVEVAKITLSADAVDDWEISGIFVSLDQADIYSEYLVEAKLDVKGIEYKSEIGVESKSMFFGSFNPVLEIPSSKNVTLTLYFKFNNEYFISPEMLQESLDLLTTCIPGDILGKPKNYAAGEKLGVANDNIILGHIHNVTINEAYVDFQKSVDDAGSGDVLEVCPAEYYIMNSIILKNKKNLVFKSKEGPAKTIFIPSSTMHVLKKIALSNCDNVQLLGFSMSGLYFPLELMDDNNNILISNCWFKDAYSAILTDDSENAYQSMIQIKTNKFNNVWTMGIEAYSLNNSIIFDNGFTECKNGGIRIQGRYRSNNLKISNNTFRNTNEYQLEPSTKDIILSRCSSPEVSYNSFDNLALKSLNSTGYLNHSVLVLINCNSAKIAGNSILGGHNGIDINSSPNSRIWKNYVFKSNYGIRVYDSDRANVISNCIENCRNAAFENIESSGTIYSGNKEKKNGSTVNLLSSVKVVYNDRILEDEFHGGIYDAGSGSLISKNQISNDSSDGFRFEGDIPPVLRNNNIQDAFEFGVNNLNQDAVVDASFNWWGDPSGPGGEGPGSGERVSINVDYSDFLTEPVSLIAAAGSDTLFLEAGASDSLYFFFRNWENEEEDVNVTLEEDFDWITGNTPLDIKLGDTLGGETIVYIEVPDQANNETANNVRAKAKSIISNVSDSALTVIVVYSPAPNKLSIYPDTLLVEIDSSGAFYHQCWDQHFNPIESDPIWSVSGGGTIDENGLFTSDGTIGIFEVTADYEGIIATAFVEVIEEIVSVDEQEGPIHGNNICRVFPNPFSDEVEFRFNAKAGTNIKIYIYDLLGIEISKLPKMQSYRTEDCIKWKPDGLRQGIYFYRIKCGNIYESGQIIYLK